MKKKQIEHRIYIKETLYVHLNSEGYVRIVGSNNALMGLAKTIRDLARMDPDDYDMPDGALLHIDFDPGFKLTTNSLGLEICQKHGKGEREKI